jgi:hypothetical protein
MRAIERSRTERISMRATVMYGAGDVRVEHVPDASISLPTDAVVRVVLSCVCGGWATSSSASSRTSAATSAR